MTDRNDKKRILIVNCYFDITRFSIQRNSNVPQAMAPAYLAGVFCRHKCEVLLYNEQYSGHLVDPKLLAWPDMLVLTGLNVAFDRMLHLTAYVRTQNSKVVVVAGGSAIRALPQLAKRYFDYCCFGDIEQIQDVIEAVFDRSYVSERFKSTRWAVPRYDLVNWMGASVSYIESSRNCYFNCNFCSIAAEGGAYGPYNPDYIRSQILALERPKIIHFLDNNFGSNDKQFMTTRFELLKELKNRKKFCGWSALSSSEFFQDENLALARDSGCLLLFSGVETFDKQALLNFKKYQNANFAQVDLIKKCLKAGITFNYGIVFDLATRTMGELRTELEFFLSTPEIPLPCYISIAAPIVGTAYFYECLNQKRFLPNVKLRDLDDTTISIKPLDDLNHAAQFVKEIQNLNGNRTMAMRHTKAFFNNYKKHLPLIQMMLAINPAFLLCTPRLSLSCNPSIVGVNLWQSLKKQKRTFIATTEPLDRAYKPGFNVDSRYAHYFEPTMLTDAGGELAEPMLADFACN